MLIIRTYSFNNAAMPSFYHLYIFAGVAVVLVLGVESVSLNYICLLRVYRWFARSFLFQSLSENSRIARIHANRRSWIRIIET